MPQTTQTDDSHDTRIVLSLLESVERDGAQSQRKLAAELGIALGLVNAYLKRCVSKGLVKVRAAPARRYAYYLTPKGFSEKSRLTIDYLGSSFAFFRRARSDCSALFEVADARGWKRVALLGISDLAEIAAICALDSRVSITAVVDPRPQTNFVGVPVVASLAAACDCADCILVTDLKSPEASAAAAAERFGAERVLIPTLLGVRQVAMRGAAE